MATRRLKLITKERFETQDPDVPFSTLDKKIVRPCIVRDSTFTDTEAKLILASIDKLMKAQDKPFLSQEFNASHSGLKSVLNTVNLSNVPEKKVENLERDLERRAEKILRESLRMQLAVSNSSFRFGYKSCGALLARRRECNSTPGNTLQRGNLKNSSALSSPQTVSGCDEEQECRIQEFLKKWTKSTNEKFSLSSRTISVYNYKYNPQKLRENLKGLLESLSHNENQDLATIKPGVLCHRVAQIALDVCRIEYLKTTEAKWTRTADKKPEAAESKPSSPSRTAAPMVPGPPKEDRKEHFKYLRALGGMPEGVLSSRAPSGSWEAALHRVAENGDLLRAFPAPLGEHSQLRRVCSLPAQLRAVRLPDSGPDRFDFDLVLDDSVLEFSAPSEEDRDRWTTCARLFITVPEIVDIASQYHEQDLQHQLAQRTARMLQRKSIAAAPGPSLAPNDGPAESAVSNEGPPPGRLPRPSSAVPAAASGAPPAARPRARRPASALM